MAHSDFANKGRERPPSLLACVTCRKKHLRCDAQVPVCGRCAYRKLPCVYLESKRGYRDRKKQSEIKATALVPAGEATYETANHSLHELRGDSTLTTDAWPVAIQDDAIPPNLTMTASPAECIVRSACFDRGQQEKVSHYSADLVDVFYSSFFPAHGFVVPRKLLVQCPKTIPEELKAVLRFVGSHFQHTKFQEILREAAFRITDDDVLIDPGFKVQGMLCLAIVFMAGRLERALGMRLLHEAIDIAVTVGLHRRTYAANRPADHPLHAESWRRTYWDLYVVDTLLSALDGSNYTSRLQDVAADLPLPGHDDDYINCRLQPPAPTMQEMADRVFAETPFNYSSGAYKVEATRIMRKVLALEADSFNVMNAQVETIDASIQSFLLSLPLHFREVVENDGKVDEVLFTAHMIIQWASIALHRPRSNLTFLRNHYRTACSSEESVGIPALSFQSHAAKAIRAANAISKLTAIQTAPALHTPCFACVIALSATVHLPAYASQTNQSEIKERLHLSVSALAAIGEVWPLASIVRAQVAQFARETFQAASLPATNTALEEIPTIAEAPRPEHFDLENMINDDSWLNELDAFAIMPLATGVDQSGWS
jgi:hypothetical protein